MMRTATATFDEANDGDYVDEDSNDDDNIFYNDDGGRLRMGTVKTPIMTMMCRCWMLVYYIIEILLCYDGLLKVSVVRKRIYKFLAWAIIVVLLLLLGILLFF